MVARHLSKAVELLEMPSNFQEVLMKKVTVFVLMIMLVSAVFAQDTAQTETGSLEDELFGGDTEALVTPEQASQKRLSF